MFLPKDAVQVKNMIGADPSEASETPQARLERSSALAEGGDAVAAAEAAVLTWFLDKSESGKQRATWFLYKVLESSDVDLLYATANALLSGKGLFMDKRLSNRFIDRVLVVSYKGHYLLGFGHYLRGDMSRARRELVISAGHGHFTSRALLLKSWMPKNKLADYLIRPFVLIAVFVLLFLAYREPNAKERLWRYQDVLRGDALLLDEKVGADRTRPLQSVFKLIGVVP